MNAVEIPFDTTRTFVEEAASVMFFARVGERTVRCYVTRSALESYFGADADHDALESSACLRAFDANARRIEAIARECLGSNGAGVRTVVLNADTVFRVLARMH
ncbi:DUF1488 family protein [Caldimonas sp. KR1-144]|uniref:DUF1488 family protein n=1 Tax=Caldimonas sp. KR1-144 TaxID=3400911 RepID=UPI003C107686